MRRRRYNARKRKFQKGLRSWMIEILAVFAVASILVFFIMQLVFVHGHAMKPNYNDGDLVFVNKIEYRFLKPKRMDVVMFRVNSGETGRYAMGRIVGLPGEYIKIKDGKLYADGSKVKLKTDILIKSSGEAQNGVDLGKDEYFILCDNFNSGEDSRMASIGKVKKKQIIGKVSFNIWHRKK